MTALGSGDLRVIDVVAQLLGSDNPPSVALHTSRQTTLVDAKGRFMRIIAHPQQPEPLLQIIDESLRRNSRAGTDVIIVGGSVTDRAVIEQGVPPLAMHPFRVAHVTSQGRVVVLPERGSASLLKALEGLRRLSQKEEVELAEVIAQQELRQQEEREQWSQYSDELKRRPAPLTKVLLGVLVLIFALQLRQHSLVEAALGPGGGGTASEQQWLLSVSIMGALRDSLVNEGQWWRLLSAGFLHHGVLHLGVNGFALWILGSKIEKVLGTQRYAVVYAASLLGGGISSYLFTQGVSAGASGAIWGLLVALLALAHGHPPILPSGLARALRPISVQYVVLNMALSFVPGIDWAAHFGGGAAGGLVLISGLLSPPKGPGSRWLLPVLTAGAVLLLAVGALMPVLRSLGSA